jgi:hypothetical protein
MKNLTILRLFQSHKSSHINTCSSWSLPTFITDTENEEMFLIVTKDKLSYLNFEKVLENYNIIPHSILHYADHEFLGSSVDPRSKLFSEIEMEENLLNILSAVKFFKVGILALCFDNGSIQFYNDNTGKQILEYKVGFNHKNCKLRNIIDVFPSYYAKKNKKDDMLTIIEGFNRIFVLNSFGNVFLLDYADNNLKLVGNIIL